MRPRVYPAEAITCRAKARPADSTCFNEATGRTPPRKPPANEHVVDGDLEGRGANPAEAVPNQGEVVEFELKFQ